jgi:hypothetical protein
MKIKKEKMENTMEAAPQAQVQTQGSLEKKKKPRHSTTIYLPRKDNEKIVRAMKLRASEKYGAGHSLGKVSKYVMEDLVFTDLFKEGIIDENGNFIDSELENREKKVLEEGSKPKYGK